MADQVTQGLFSPWLRAQRFKVARPLLRGQVLDVGCGAGAFAQFFEQANYVGVDLNSLSLERARVAFTRHCFRDRLPESGMRFDSVVSFAVIENTFLHREGSSRNLQSL